MSINAPGSFGKTAKFLAGMSRGDYLQVLDQFGRLGVEALASATPVDSGVTANSWTYEVIRKRGQHTIIWRNTHMASGTPVAILIQYGHGTGTGGYVQGRDFINPAIRPVFDRIANEVWEQVRNG